jgi:hypothetical protein
MLDVGRDSDDPSFICEKEEEMDENDEEENDWGTLFLRITVENVIKLGFVWE